MSKSETTGPRAMRSQEGSALVLAVFVLALLTAMGAALLFLSQNSVKSAEASVRPKKAFFYAEAGLEHARRSLWIANGPNDFDNELLFAANTNGIEFDPDNVAAVRDSSGNVTGFNGYGDDRELVSMQTLDDGWYAAFMSNDYAEGRANEIDTDNRVILSGVGAGPDGSFEVVEAVINIERFLPEMPPATIFMLGAPRFASGNSSSKVYSGNDCGVAGGDYYPVVGTIGSAAEADVEAGVSPNPTWENGPYGSDPTDSIADLTGFPVSGMSDTTYSLDSEWQDCQAMKDLVEGLRLHATTTCADGTRLGQPSCPATVTDPRNIYFGEGDLDVSLNVTHTGILVVTGELTLAGSVDFNGLILVAGEGILRMNGAGAGVVSGGMIIADIAGPDGVYGNADDCTGPNNGFGDSVYDERGGGNAGTQYCSSVLDITVPAKPYEILEFRQN